MLNPLSILALSPTVIRLTLCAMLVASFLAVAGPLAGAAEPPDSQRCEFSFELAERSLEGTFPIEVASSDAVQRGSVTLVGASDRGDLAGTMLLGGETLSVSGRCSSSKRRWTVRLQAAANARLLRFTGTLRGISVRGTVRGGPTGSRRSSFIIDLSEATPLMAHASIVLASNERGRALGGGTVTIGSRSLAVQAKEATSHSRTRLTLLGSAFRWSGIGVLGVDGLSLDWTSRAGGMSARGTDLHVLSEFESAPPESRIGERPSSVTKLKASFASNDAAAIRSAGPIVMTWAYYTDGGAARYSGEAERWYISYIGSAGAGKTSVYSLMAFDANGHNGWGDVGDNVASVNLFNQTVSVDRGLDNTSSDSYYDVGWQAWASNPLMHRDRQRIQGSTVAIKWYFFHVPSTGRWYIVAAPGYGDSSDVRLFSQRSGPYGLEYDWIPVTGTTASFSIENGQKVARFDGGQSEFDTPQNRADLAAVIMSETSAQNTTEAVAVGYTVLNRMKTWNYSTVLAVWDAYAHGQSPSVTARDVAGQILSGAAADISQGAMYFYSPISMPKDGDPITGFDVGGGLEWTDGLTSRNYRPSWAATHQRVYIAGISEARFKFYR